MRLSPTLLGYIGRQFAVALGAILAVLLTVVFTFDAIELLRRASGRPDVRTELVLQMALLKLPQMGEQLAPFVVLFAAMVTFWRLTRTHELTVARSAGVSVWQFLVPIAGLAILFGVFKTTAINPAAAVLYGNFERIEAQLLRGRSSLLAVAESGLWLRQIDAGGNSVVHARRVASQNVTLFEVIILNFEGQDRFIGRIDAASARLEDGHWAVTDAWISAPERPSRFERSFRVPTTMTAEQVQDSFASPLTISFWALPEFISMLEAAGFSATRHRLHWHQLVAGPLLLAAMVLIAATFALRPHRRGGAGSLVVAGIGVGFALFFASSLIGALGQSGAIPVALAAWTPAVVSAMLGTAMLLHLEDG